jgi:hypothetical protein
VAACTTAVERSMVIENISSGVVRVYPHGNTRLTVRPDNSTENQIIDRALGGPCQSDLFVYCDLRPGRRLLATTAGFFAKVDVGIDVPASESLKVAVATTLINAALGPHVPPPTAAIASCVQNMQTAVTSGTRAQQVHSAISSTFACTDAIEQIRDLEQGANEAEHVISIAGIERDVLRGDWIDDIALRTTRIIEFLR